ncbi:MAG: HEAT repeat domain-containing protein [Anaerolineae bacterium]|nr:HEAT repeat domain-containing protein [Anaerolineae bacterium]
MPIDKALLKQLKHPDARERQRAIAQLANTRDADAIAPLEEISRIDDDAKVRQLAIKALDFLSQRVQKPGKEAPAVVTERDVERARGHMDTAMSLVVNNENAKATKELAKALQTNPNLKDDPYFLSLAGSVLGVGNEEALAMLRSGEKRGDFIKKSEKVKTEKRKSEHLSKAREITTPALAFDLSIYGVVLAVLTFLTPLILSQLMGRMVANAASMEDLDASTRAMLAEMGDPTLTFQQLGIGILLVVAIVSAIASVIALAIQGGLIHLVATRLLKGKGTFTYMMCQITPFYTMVTVVFFIWTLIAMTLASTGAVLIGGVCMLPMILASLFVFFKAAGKIGEAYDFGVGSGCLSILIASIILAVVSNLLTWLIARSAIEAMLQTMSFTG